MGTVLFTNVRVFEGTADALVDAEVLVQGNRIATVAEGRRLPRPRQAEVIDGGGATLMPGMVNPHCHFTYSNAVSLADINALPVEEHVLVTMRNARTYLEHGFTAVIGMASAKPRLEIAARNAIDRGEYPGPRIRASTPEFTVTGGVGDDSRLDRHVPSIGIVLDGADAFRRAVRELLREGADIVKFNNSGDSFTFGRMPGERNPMSEEEVAAICHTTLNLGRRLAAHAHADSGVRQCLRHGVEFINHATFASDETIAQLAAARDRHWVIPAIAARWNTVHEASAFGITREVAAAIGNERELEVGCETMRRMHAAGVRVLPFGDYGFAWLPIGQDARDLEHMVKLFGFAPWEALRAATAWGGEAWAGTSGDKLGRVAPGYLADLIVVDGDPLADITVLQERARITAVMKDGTFFRRPPPGAAFASARGRRRRAA